MRLRWIVMPVVFVFSVLAVYCVCREQGGAVDTIVGMARRVTFGALMGVGFFAASYLLQRLMSQTTHVTTPVVIAASSIAPEAPVPSFPVASGDPSSRYRVRGFDKDTKFETVEFVYANSPSNAQMKVELKGVQVAAVERAR